MFGLDDKNNVMVGDDIYDDYESMQLVREYAHLMQGSFGTQNKCLMFRISF